LSPLVSLGIVASIVGVASDFLTTINLPSDDSGRKFESNASFMRICEKWGYKAWIGIEILIIIFLELIDLIILNQLFFGVFYGAFRGVAAIRNFKIINDYQKVGINAFRKDAVRRKKYFARALQEIRACRHE
jgi:hypothetical protein